MEAWKEREGYSWCGNGLGKGLGNGNDTLRDSEGANVH